MSNSLAIAAVTKALRELLFTGINADPDLSGTDVTTQPPDLARDGRTTNQVNLFLYLMTIDAAWRNMDMPDRVHPGETGFPPLPLTLHYVITAYGRIDDLHDGHHVLGKALSVLHDRPVLSPADLALPKSDLDRQVERVRLTAGTLNVDEMSRLWTTFQTQYRVSAAYQASVVLIESTLPVNAPLPVLRRGSDDRGPTARSDLEPPPVPTIVDVALAGDEVTISGHDLDGTAVAVRLTHPALAGPVVLTGAALLATSDSEVRFTLPADMPAGTLTIVVLVTRTGPPIPTNETTLAIRPRITSPLPLNAVRDGFGKVDVPIDLEPMVRAGQQAFLLVGSDQVPAKSFVPPASTLHFVFAIDVGTYVIRLRIGGVDSEIVDRSVTPPVFDLNQRLKVTA
jgi:hypothetical protein